MFLIDSTVVSSDDHFRRVPKLRVEQELPGSRGLFSII
jgi:hypothetical protein